jgi:hypothetical protein
MLVRRFFGTCKISVLESNSTETYETRYSNEECQRMQHHDSCIIFFLSNKYEFELQMSLVYRTIWKLQSTVFTKFSL